MTIEIRAEQLAALSGTSSQLVQSCPAGVFPASDRGDNVDSDLAYPPGFVPTALERQVAVLREYWPKLVVGPFVAEYEKRAPPAGKVYTAFVRWQALSPSYLDAIRDQFVPALKKTFGPIGMPKEVAHVETCRLTSNALAKLGSWQKGDIYVVASELGIERRGQSSGYAHEQMAAGKSPGFGHTTCAAACILLTSPKRLSNGYLGIDCPGDLANVPGYGMAAPAFNMYDDTVVLGVHHADTAVETCAPLIGFL